MKDRRSMLLFWLSLLKRFKQLLDENLFYEDSGLETWLVLLWLGVWVSSGLYENRAFGVNKLIFYRSIMLPRLWDLSTLLGVKS